MMPTRTIIRSTRELRFPEESSKKVRARFFVRESFIRGRDLLNEILLGFGVRILIRVILSGKLAIGAANLLLGGGAVDAQYFEGIEDYVVRKANNELQAEQAGTLVSTLPPSHPSTAQGHCRSLGQGGGHSGRTLPVLNTLCAFFLEVLWLEPRVTLLAAVSSSLRRALRTRLMVTGTRVRKSTANRNTGKRLSSALCEPMAGGSQRSATTLRRVRSRHERGAQRGCYAWRTRSCPGRVH
eukprot:scaffold4409_cov369-Prasinococcus_capsulatus_cf.AAC.41